MYLDHFGLKELPFRLSPDPAFLYLSQIHSRAKAYMESTIWFTDGFVVITGEIGSGKTTLIETFLKEIEQDVVVAQINQTQVSPIEFLQGLLAQFGFSPFRMRKAELLDTLNNFLIEQHANGRRVLLIIDEAQNLSNKVLEEVRLLSGVETTKEKVLRIILAGQPELHAKLDSDELIQLRQRVRLRFHLSALTESEMGAYILHRLRVAGSEDREIFEPDTFPLIFRYTGGIPRLTNTLCDTCLLSAFGSDLDKVDVELVRKVIGELQWQEYAGRTHTDLPATRIDDTSPQPRPPVGRVVLSKRGVTIDHALLVPGRFIVGRTTDNDMQIDSKFVSRHHMQLVTSVDNCYVEDLNSTNGVFLNGKRVRRHKLQPGDVIIGDLLYTYDAGSMQTEYDEDGTKHEVTNPSEFPEGKIAEVYEPMIKATILSPAEVIGTIIELCQGRRGVQLGLDYLSEDRVELRYTLPLAEIVFDFFDQLKSRTQGYASLDYEPTGEQEADLVKVDILLHGEPVDAFSAIVHKDKAYAYGVQMAAKLRELIPRQQFEVPIQAAIGSRIIARETIRAIRKDVLAKCYGGDITRKRKLLEKQKEGKKRMKMVGRVEVPQEAFIAALSTDDAAAKPGAKGK